MMAYGISCETYIISREGDATYRFLQLCRFCCQVLKSVKVYKGLYSVMIDTDDQRLKTRD